MDPDSITIGSILQLSTLVYNEIMTKVVPRYIRLLSLCLSTAGVSLFVPLENECGVRHFWFVLFNRNWRNLINKYFVICTDTQFFIRNPIIRNQYSIFSELRNRVLMFQVHKKLASHFSNKRRIFVQK